jgi:hypothetical protein
MKLSWRSLFAALGLLVGAAGVQAEEVSLAPNFEPFAAPDIAASDITLVGHCTDGCADACAEGCTDQCTSCAPSRHVGRDFWVCKDRGCGWVGGVEFLLLKPYAGGGYLSSGTAQMNFNPAYRLTLGRQNADGLGARIRYFEFDRGATGVGNDIGVEARYFDAELTQAVDFRRSSLLFSGGLRYAQYEAANNLATPAPTSFGFDGFGLTFSGQATRDLTKSGSLRMVSTARWSAVYGNSKFGAANTHVNDNLVNIFEINIGPQYRRQLRRGAYLTLGGGFEAQYWSNAFTTTTMPSADVGFAGFGSQIAITR